MNSASPHWLKCMLLQAVRKAVCDSSPLQVLFPKGGLCGPVEESVPRGGGWEAGGEGRGHVGGLGCCWGVNQTGRKGGSFGALRCLTPCLHHVRNICLPENSLHTWPSNFKLRFFNLNSSQQQPGEGEIIKWEFLFSFTGSGDEGAEKLPSG